MFLVIFMIHTDNIAINSKITTVNTIKKIKNTVGIKKGSKIKYCTIKKKKKICIVLIGR